MKQLIKMRKGMIITLVTIFVLIVGGVILNNIRKETATPELLKYEIAGQEGFYSGFLDMHQDYDNELSYSYSALDFILEEGELISPGSFYIWEDENSISLNITDVEKGLYHIHLNYKSTATNHLPIVIDVKIDEQTPYDEASQTTLDTYWVEADDEVKTDRYGNDVAVLKSIYEEFLEKPLKDPSRLYRDGLLFYIDDLNSTLKLQKVSGHLHVKSIKLIPKKTVKDYETYLESNEVSNKFFNRIEAEEVFLMNNSSITRGISRDVGVLPFSTSKMKLNVLGTETYLEPGDAATWKTGVEEPGYYYITLKTLQNRQKSTVYRTLYINGEVPFEEAKHLPFSFHSKWQNSTLSNFDGEPFLFYLEPGDTISLEVDGTLFIDIARKMRIISNEVTQFGLEVTKLTRNNVDPNIDWDMLSYFPDLKERFSRWDKGLSEVIEALETLYGYKSDSQATSDLKAARNKLNVLNKKLDEIPRRLNLLSTGSSSAVMLISGQIDLVLQQPLVFDAIFIHGKVKLPQANASIFKRTWVSIKRFFTSFFDPAYTQHVDDDEIEVWVNRSRQYVDLIQRLTDGTFTEETGIKVKVSIMNDDGKLLLANSANQQPDVALGISSWIPNDYGMRGMLVDLSELEDFSATASLFNPEQLVPMIYDNQLYGLPETENFYVLAYRKDILEQLSLAIPNTWDDVLGMLPVLERYGMSFYVPLSSVSALKSFDATAPFIYQFGGKLYNDDGLSAAIDNEKTIEAMTFMADLFREYSLSYQVPSFFNSFRYGRIPIGIMDFGMYLQLLNAASEIKGLWDIALVPGVMHEDGINRSMPGAQQSSLIFKKSKKIDESWKFLQWWHKTETQVMFAERLVNTLGTRYLWNTANPEAFALLNWNKDHQAIILEQWEHLKEVPKIPGSYMVEREISNILNSVVFFDANLRSTINDSILKMDKEITRKMFEFGYIDSRGNSIKPFIIPNKDIVEGWVNKDE